MSDKALTENDNLIHISILGSCVIRDTIGISHEKEKFFVDRFVQSVNPLSIVAKSPLKRDIGDRIWKYNPKTTKFSRFYRRIFNLDLNKNVITYICETDADWLLLDVSCLKHPLIKNEMGLFTDFLHSLSSWSFAEQLIKEGYLSKNYETILPENINEKDLYAGLDKFIEEILKHYNPEHIVLFEICPAKYCITKDKTVSRFPYKKKYDLVKTGYEYVLNKLPDCHVIAFPESIVGDEQHKWGKNELHYVNEYYDYAYSALEKIIGGVYIVQKNRNKRIYAI